MRVCARHLAEPAPELPYQARHELVVGRLGNAIAQGGKAIENEEDVPRGMELVLRKLRHRSLDAGHQVRHGIRVGLYVLDLRGGVGQRLHNAAGVEHSK